MNPIEYLVSKGGTVTSDPRRYASGVWGLRNYTEFGINYDAFCNGRHPAYDLAWWDGAPLPAVWDGTIEEVVYYGNFGAHVTLSDNGKKYQVIYGHLKRNIPVKVGQKVKKGQTIGYQGNTNYHNVYMASHLHIQFQVYGWYNTEYSFVCTGVDPLKINVGGSISNASTKAIAYHSAWDWTGKVKITTAVNYRIYPHDKAKKEDVIPAGTTLNFDRLYYSGKYWWIRTLYKGGVWFVALGKKETGVPFLTALDGGKLWATSVGKVNTSGGKVTGDKNTYQLSEEFTVNTPIVSKSKTFNRNVNRGRSTSAYVMGTIDNLGAQVRNRRGSRKTGFNFNSQAGYRLPAGSTIYIFEVHDGWGRIYTGNLSGRGSNEWIYLERLQVQYVYK